MATQRTLSDLKLSRILIPVFLFLFLTLGALYFLRTFKSSPQKDPYGRISIQKGAHLPDFEITGFDGHKLLLSKINSKILLINFWASWCESCMHEMPSLVKLRDTFHTQGLEILGINLDEHPETIISKTKQAFDMKFPIFTDEEGKLSDLFDVHAIPLTVVINHEREILLIYDGEKNWFSPAMQAQTKEWLSK